MTPFWVCCFFFNTVIDSNQGFKPRSALFPRLHSFCSTTWALRLFAVHVKIILTELMWNYIIISFISNFHLKMLTSFWLGDLVILRTNEYSKNLKSNVVNVFPEHEFIIKISFLFLNYDITPRTSYSFSFLKC